MGFTYGSSHKKDKTIRTCVDYRGLNKSMDAEPLMYPKDG